MRGQRKIFALRYVAEHAETAGDASDLKQARAALTEAKKKGTAPWEKIKKDSINKRKRSKH